MSKLKDVDLFKDVDYSLKINNSDFLEIDDYFRALDEGIAENLQDELFIRKYIWWTYNDRIRYDRSQSYNSIFIDEKDELRWNENCNKLISLLDPSDIHENIMIAELHRNLGDFDACIDIIKKINLDGMNWIKDLLIIECERKNRRNIPLRKYLLDF